MIPPDTKKINTSVSKSTNTTNANTTSDKPTAPLITVVTVTKQLFVRIEAETKEELAQKVQQTFTQEHCELLMNGATIEVRESPFMMIDGASFIKIAGEAKQLAKQLTAVDEAAAAAKATVAPALALVKGGSNVH